MDKKTKAGEVSREIQTTTSGEGLVQFHHPASEKIPDNYYVLEISHKEAYPWLLKKHYAKRLCSICHSFGILNKENEIQGVCTFGAPPAPTENELWKPFELLELNRLVVNDGLPKNVLSYFVSSCLKKLPEPRVVISYADIDWNHCGYIYQATNWIYTGVGSKNIKSYIMKDGKCRHSRHKYLIKEREIKEIKRSVGKHRYFYFIGNRRQKKQMKRMLLERYKIETYPKLEPKHYNAKYKPILQTRLFGDI